ncbi:fused predicted transporter subunit of ABC superfamily: ATP-binding component [Lentisphaera araneosa HTCC2155]|uniref:Fused predicted transporter subunit of ABC superfamily: ATP-binding component n=1 Tax=Lentisphaera araneosa HTCC2155 TaxID=313628 RepID=A6DLD8_9BACT|nr:ATP-binding cassette domain-containing protein [Lentisphaera araneosa]EDM27393.1 fused predicted transporter subunit of ABC superfamily: ATP-binding component [Lentisphaera araneosa HTCC2155]
MKERGIPLLDAIDLTYAIGHRMLLDHVSFTIHNKDRVGLIGRNGTGKSTLLKILSKQLEPFEVSEIRFSKGLKVSYLSQDFDIDPNLTVIENIREGAGYIYELLKQYESGDQTEDEMFRIQDQITALDAWDLDAYVFELISRLSCPSADTPCKDLSGGEKRRINLAKVLVSKPDLLILDEPTNHLDSHAVEWLEKWLETYSGALIMVTHDRCFLDSVCNRILELREGQADFFPGNYSVYLEQSAARDMAMLRADNKRHQFLKKELEWVRRSPKARTTKSQSRVDRFNDLNDKENYAVQADAELVLPPAKVIGNVSVSLENVCKSFGDKQLFKDLSFELEPGSRIALMGGNGMGKTTLLKMIIGQAEADSGTIVRGASLDYNYVDQSRSQLNEDNTVFKEVADGAESVRLGDISLSTRSYLRRFLFTDDRINTKVSKLSGGERNRLLLARLLRKPCNLLILDEPTNDLDLSTLQVLEEALVAWKGTLLLVSHDRWFVNRVCNGILGFEGNGQVYYQDGDYDYYLEKKAERETKQVKVEVETKKVAPKAEEPKKATKKLTWKEERELEGMEDFVMELDEQISAIETAMHEPDFFQQEAELIQEKTNELESLRQKLDQAYARWEELEAKKA